MISDFLKMEKENNLFSIKLMGIPLWPLVRSRIYERTLAKLNHKDDASIGSKTKAKDNFKSIFQIVIESVKFLFKKKQSVDFLILAHPRRKKINDYYIDIYTDPLVKYLDGSTLIMEPMHKLSHYNPTPSEVLKLDIIDYWPRIISNIFYKLLFIKELEKFNCVDSFFMKKGIEFQSKSLVKKEFIRALISIYFFKKLLRKVKPHLIIEVVGYSRLSQYLNLAASHYKIETLELQHSDVGENHISYNFNKEQKNMVESYPDYLAVWGKYFKKNINAPIEQENILVVGFPYFWEKMEKAKSDLNIKNKSVNKEIVTVISQPGSGKELLNFCIKLISICDNIKIYFKPHPNELSEIKSYQKVIANTDNIVLVTDDDIELYSLIKTSDIILGIHSTVLLEAAVINKKVLILKIPGWEHYQYLIKDPKLDVYLIEQAEEFNEVINIENKATNSPKNNSYFSQLDLSFELLKN
ncbi:hypothetical protein GYB29_02465 [bacterium]|jgi:UDP-N-acetylglucosamine:LPS N-acetylglucosamine transferase|nr:hypothetical protein [bacterium]